VLHRSAESLRFDTQRKVLASRLENISGGTAASGKKKKKKKVEGIRSTSRAEKQGKRPRGCGLKTVRADRLSGVSCTRRHPERGVNVHGGRKEQDLP